MDSLLNNLDSIGIKYGTDKSSKGHNYLSTYEYFLNSYRNKRAVLMEIGGGVGASIKMWEEYFPKSKIICVDINPDVKKYESDRISVEIGDISSKEVIKRLQAKYPKVDILIDDGSHRWDHQRIAFENLFKIVSPGGYYIVEDLHSSYEPNFSGLDSLPFIEYLKNRIDFHNLRGENGSNYIKKMNPGIVGLEKQIHFLSFTSRACIIKKRI
ncbi:polyamine aminopropyltransferase [Metabacillus arenae]|uniref:Class I SAM-dependent methyltransferase n=1 Tax=Metabacillus arenae TaxID=2771434 RepID=A0A926NDS8_9BACI|nr:class I SAM-dependent methyltransferase [Metabacillus arenae]MBD1378990.1 class I SAM-dependent methyltransferase [Metabacillus arenae]